MNKARLALGVTAFALSTLVAEAQVNCRYVCSELSQGKSVNYFEACIKNCFRNPGRFAAAYEQMKRQKAARSPSGPGNCEVFCSASDAGCVAARRRACGY